MCVIGSNAAESYGSQHFCVNNGECRDVHSSPDEPFAGCYCPEGYDGMHCEVDIVNGTTTLTTDFDAGVSSSNNSDSDRSNGKSLSSTDVFFFTMGLCAVGILAMIAIRKYRTGRRSRNASNILNAFQDSVDEHEHAHARTRNINSGAAAYHDNNGNDEDVLSGDSFSRRGLRRDLEGDVVSSGTRSGGGSGGKSSTSGSKHSFFSGFS